MFDIIFFACFVNRMSFGGRGRGGGKRRKWGANGFEEWGGYMAAKKSKLQEQFSEDAKVEETETGIFAGVAIFVNGYTGMCIA